MESKIRIASNDERARIRAVVFDLDGTLLDTMPDLAAAANEALRCMGFRERTYGEMLSFMGRGGAWLIDHLVAPDATAEQRAQMFELWRDLYIGSEYALTAPFDGAVSAVRTLRERGVKTAVLSNKFDVGVRTLTARHFPGLFDIVQGDAPPLPRKPDPRSLLNVLDELGVAAQDAVYVGDTRVDAETAQNAGVRAVGVSWGYAKCTPLPIAELDAYVRSFDELLAIAVPFHLGG